MWTDERELYDQRYLMDREKRMYFTFIRVYCRQKKNAVKIHTQKHQMSRRQNHVVSTMYCRLNLTIQQHSNVPKQRYALSPCALKRDQVVLFLFEYEKYWNWKNSLAGTSRKWEHSFLLSYYSTWVIPFLYIRKLKEVFLSVPDLLFRFFQKPYSKLHEDPTWWHSHIRGMPGEAIEEELLCLVQERHFWREATERMSGRLVTNCHP